MSAHLMITAAYCAPFLPTPAHVLVLMKFGDSADERNRLGFPGRDAARIWSRTGVSRFQEIVQDLQELGYLMHVEKGRRGRRAVYRVFPSPGDEVMSVAFKEGQACPGAEHFAGPPPIPSSDDDIAALLGVIASGSRPQTTTQERRKTTRTRQKESGGSDPNGKGPAGQTQSTGPDQADPEPATGSDASAGLGLTHPPNGSDGSDPFGTHLPSPTTSSGGSEMPPSSASPRATPPQADPPDPSAAQPDGPPGTATRTGTAKAAPGKRRASRAKVERTPDEQARFDTADRIAHGWWDEYCPRHGIPVTSAQNRSPASGFPGFRKLLESFLAAGCSENELKRALVAVGRAWPSRTALETAVSQQRGRNPAASPRGGPPVYREDGAARALAGVFD